MRTHYTSEITPEMNGRSVTVAGWMHEVRDLGGVRFIILRDRKGLLQITAKKKATPPEALQALDSVKETAIVVTGAVKAEKQAPRGVELLPQEARVVGAVTATIPFEVTGKVPADIDVRLDNRYIDLRRPQTQAVFRIRSEVLRSFREALLALDFQEINPPCIVAAATEGGTDLFPIVYFEKEAFLAQSPQLYKQLAVVGGMDKVFMITPVFRAEKHHTTAHLNEITQMDIEMGFADHNDAMGVLEAVTLGILRNVKNNCSEELALLGSSVEIPNAIKRYKYGDAVEMLQKNGEPMEWGSDFNKEQEAALCKLIGEPLFFITDWPTRIRAFYSMPQDERTCNAFDLMYCGVEIASGAQRIHVPALLEQQLRARGLEPSHFEFYINAFRMGAPPHAGWSMGVERILMKLCNKHNIRECALFPRDRTRITP